jgi:ABC-2 type transport system permease protein
VIAQTRAELLKLRSTRTTLGLVIGLLALLLLTTLLTGLVAPERELVFPDDQRDLFSLGTIAGLFAALCGVLLVTGEFRFRTIRSTVLVTPRRSTVLLGKTAASALAGLALGVLAAALALAIGYLSLSGRGIDIVVGNGDLAQLILGGIAATAVWGAIGVGLGAVVRNQVGAVIGLLAWLFVVEHLLFGLVPSVGRYTPSEAEDALIGSTERHLVAPAAGALLLVAWAVLVVAAGAALVARRDVD